MLTQGPYANPKDIIFSQFICLFAGKVEILREIKYYIKGSNLSYGSFSTHYGEVVLSVFNIHFGKTSKKL